jgi:hypothetical protein
VRDHGEFADADFACGGGVQRPPDAGEVLVT